MNDDVLRLILLVLGVAILLAIYFFDKFKNRPESTDEQQQSIRPAVQEKVIPVISDEPVEPVTETDEVEIEPIEDVPEIKVVDEPVEADVLTDVAEAEEVGVVADAPEMLIQVAVLAQDEGVLSGTELLNCFTSLSLEFGEMGIYHRYQYQHAVKKPVFHVVNVTEPGVFPAGDMADFETKGLMLFMQASESVDPVVTFEEMLAAAHHLSEQFKASLMDEKMQPLTLHRISEIKAELLASRAL